MTTAPNGHLIMAGRGSPYLTAGTLLDVDPAAPATPTPVPIPTSLSAAYTNGAAIFAAWKSSLYFFPWLDQLPHDGVHALDLATGTTTSVAPTFDAYVFTAGSVAACAASQTQ